MLYNKFLLKIIIPLIIFAILAFGIDRIIKEFILIYFLFNPKPLVVTNFFSLELIYNYGISFSFLSGLNSNLISLVSIASLLVLLIVFYKMFNFSKIGIKLAIGILVGAALGNIYDRMKFGGVIDFIYFHYKDYGFPVFNSADVLITVSAIILLAYLLFEKKKVK